MGKIIPFSKRIGTQVTPNETQEPKEKLQPLTPLMIKTLKIAYEKQKNNIPFGPVDIDGSSTALISRGLLKIRTVLKDGVWERTWYVTKKAVVLLKNAVHKTQK